MVLVLLVLIGAFAWYYPLVVQKEEAFLLSKFGEPYAAYRREVPRWRPNFRLWNEPAQADAQPKFIRRTMMDALVFFLALPAFAVIAALQAHGTLPVWLTLP